MLFIFVTSVKYVTPLETVVSDGLFCNDNKMYFYITKHGKI